MNKKAITLILFFLLISTVSADGGIWDLLISGDYIAFLQSIGFDIQSVKHTPNTLTVCNKEGICEKTIYSGLKYVKKEGQWQDISQLTSLKGIFDINYIEIDPSFDMNIIDFNYTDLEIELQFKGEPESYPDQCQVTDALNAKCDFKIDEKWITYDALGNPTENSQVKFQYKWEMKAGIITKGDKVKFEYKGNPIGKKFKYGGNSTTIILQEPDTEDQAATDMTAGASSYNYGANPEISIGYGNYEQEAIFRWIPSLPDGATVIKADLNLYLYRNDLDAGESNDFNIYHVYQYPTYAIDGVEWLEGIGNPYQIGTAGEMVYEHRPLPTDDYNTFVMDSMIIDSTTPLGWKALNIKEAIIADYENGDQNTSVLITSGIVSGTPTTDWVYFYSEDYVTDTSLRPKLHIEYLLSGVAVEITQPTGEEISWENVIDGNRTINFNVASTDTNNVNAKVYYSTSQAGYENLIRDINLTDAGLNPTADLNCAGIDFGGFVGCIIDFNFMSIPEGIWYIDINAYADDGNNSQFSESFTTDFNKIAPKLNQPQTQTLNYTTVPDGNYPIEFEITTKGTLEPKAKIYYSTTKGGTENLIRDINLIDAGLNPTTDLNCTGINWTTTETCTIDFNFASISDGVYYIDVNAYLTNGDINIVSGNSFIVDFIEEPTTYLTLPSYEDFENTDMNWMIDLNIDADPDCDWIRDNLGTTSSSTGPCSGSASCGSPAGANGTDYYIYVETSSGYCYNNGQEAWTITSYEINFDAWTDENIQFYKNMYGTNIGTITLDENTTGSWNNLWSETGNQGTQWDTNTVDLSSLTGKGNLRFKYVAVGGYLGDIAIDEITINGTEGGSPPATTCDDNSYNANWTITDDCSFKDQDINIGTGMLSINCGGSIGLDNAHIYTDYEYINIEYCATENNPIKRKNGGDVILTPN